MKQRCTNSKREDYEHYGGRGITFDPRWKFFVNFLSDMGERPDDKTLDRIDVNGNYEPGNCKWSSKLEQANNKRNSSKNKVDSDWDNVEPLEWDKEKDGENNE